MNQRENFKDVTINNRTFRIKKFNAMTGGFMLIKVTGMLAPFVKSLDLNKLKEAKNPSELGLDLLDVSSIMTALGNISEADFSFIQTKCLQVCSELLPAGPAPVLNDNGSFGAIGLEEDTMTVLALIVHALIFNVKGFFQGSPLASMLGGLLTTSPQD